MKNLKKCEKCGAVIKVLKNCTCDNCGIKCCGEEMKEVSANVVECAVEKHIPNYEKIENEIQVKVNHVMEEKHYIEWISLVYEDTEIIKKLEPGKEAVVKFPYIQGAVIYAYCNLHGLWKKEVE